MSVLGLWIQGANVGMMRTIARLPLPWLRAMGWLMGQVLHAVAVARRRVAQANVRVCFPHLSPREQAQMVRRHFVAFGQAWVDRSWLWHAPEAVVAGRLRLMGDVHGLAGSAPTVVFAPHFVGLDAGWTALTLNLPRRFSTLYAPQKDAIIDAWMVQGRQRFGQPDVVAKSEGLKPLVAALRAGEPLYLLPDMDHGLGDSLWARFMGVPAATLTSLPRLAKLGRAQVVAVTSRLTPGGYDVQVWPVWPGYPSVDLAADVQRMNDELERLVSTMPEQYYWVHKRFKTRPPGEPSVYER